MLIKCPSGLHLLNQTEIMKNIMTNSQVNHVEDQLIVAGVSTSEAAFLTYQITKGILDRGDNPMKATFKLHGSAVETIID
jgi:hypothetical protein